MSPIDIRIRALEFATAIQNHFEVVDEAHLIRMAKKIEKFIVGLG